MTRNPRLFCSILSVFVLALAVFSTGCAKKSHSHAGLYVSYSEYNDLMARVERLEGNRTTYKSRLSAIPDGYLGTYMAIPTGSEATSSVLVEKMMPEKVTAGSSFDYYIVVTNLTDSLILEDVMVRDELAPTFRVANSMPQASVSGRTATWDLGTLEPGDSEKITITGTADSVGDLLSCATVDYTPVLCLGTVAELPELQVRYSGDTDVIACDIINYNIRVTNSGTGIAENVVVRSTLPDGLTTTNGERAVMSVVGSLAAGESRDLPLTAKASRAGVYRSSVTVSSDNVSSIESEIVSTSVCQPALDIAVSGDAFFLLGTGGEIELTVSNPSDCAVEGTTVSATLPACIRVDSASDSGQVVGNTVTWNVGSLRGGASDSMTIKVAASEICKDQVIVSANGDCADAISDRMPIEVAGIPAILLEVIDIQDPVRVGGTTTYVITATNQGSADGTNIIIEAEVEDMRIDTVGGATNGTISGKKVRFSALPRLAPGAKAEWRVEVTVTDSGDQRFTLQMNSDQLSRPVEETESTNTYE